MTTDLWTASQTEADPEQREMLMIAHLHSDDKKEADVYVKGNVIEAYGIVMGEVGAYSTCSNCGAWRYVDSVEPCAFCGERK